MAFSIGDRVEIYSKKDDGFVDSFYKAKVIERLGEDSYKVQRTDMSDKVKPGRLAEIVSADELRPAPRRRRLPTKLLRREVDVFDDDDGWWVGQVTAKLPGPKYRVYMYHSGEHTVSPAYGLRIHEDWINGGWVYPKHARYDCLES